MRSGTECAPRKCKCGAPLAKPDVRCNRYETTGYRYGIKDCPIHTYIKEDWDGQWQIRCKCGRDYIWSYHPVSNGCWKIRSPLPLFDTQEIIVIA